MQMYHKEPGRTQISRNTTKESTKEYNISSAWALWRYPLAMVRLPQICFLANHLASNDNLTSLNCTKVHKFSKSWTKDRTHTNEN